MNCVFYRKKGGKMLRSKVSPNMFAANQSLIVRTLKIISNITTFIRYFVKIFKFRESI